MKLLRGLLSIGMVLALGVSLSHLVAEETAPKEPVIQKTCPIMGGAINKSQFVDVEGKRIYVCCPMCIEKVKADPKAALKKLEELGETAEDAPKAAAPDAKAEAGKMPAGCPMNCPPGMKNKAEKMAGKAEAKLQKQCPLMNAPAKRDLYVDHNGKRIYVCCQMCLAAVQKDPAAAIKKLQEMGETVEDTPKE